MCNTNRLVISIIAIVTLKCRRKTHTRTRAHARALTHIHTYEHTRANTCTHTYARTCTHADTHLIIYKCARGHTNARMCIGYHSHLHLLVYSRACAHTHTDTQTHRHTHTHTHTHTALADRAWLQLIKLDATIELKRHKPLSQQTAVKQNFVDAKHRMV